MSPEGQLQAARHRNSQVSQAAVAQAYRSALGQYPNSDSWDVTDEGDFSIAYGPDRTLGFAWEANEMASISRLEQMARNPRGDWSIHDVQRVCEENGIECMPPRGGGSHYKLGWCGKGKGRLRCV